MPENGPSGSVRIVNERASLSVVLGESRVWRLWRRVGAAGDDLTVWYRRSRLQGAIDVVVRAGARSRLARWFHASPDASVVIIDVRETVTIGSAVTVLERASKRIDDSRLAVTARSGLSRTRAAISNAPIRITSGFVLGVLLGRFLATWSTWSDTQLGIYALLAAPLLIGLRIDRSLDDVANGRLRDRTTDFRDSSKPPDDDRR